MAPYLPPRYPKLLVEIVPPTVATATVQGSWPHINPWGSAASLSALMVTPAPTSAIRSAARISIFCNWRKSSTIPGMTEDAPPISPLPPPTGITGHLAALATRSTEATSSVHRGLTTHKGCTGSPAGKREGCRASRAIKTRVSVSVAIIAGSMASRKICTISSSDIPILIYFEATKRFQPEEYRPANCNAPN